MNRAGRYWKEWKAAKAAVDRVRELHRRGDFDMCTGCGYDQHGRPAHYYAMCPTLRALDGEQA